MNDPQQRARELIAGVLGQEPLAIPDDASFGTQQGWDSLAHFRLVSALESERGKELSTDEMLSMRTLQDVANTLRGISEL